MIRIVSYCRNYLKRTTDDAWDVAMNKQDGSALDIEFFQNLADFLKRGDACRDKRQP